jgi:predicted Zn-dependent protease
MKLHTPLLCMFLASALALPARAQGEAVEVVDESEVVDEAPSRPKPAPAPAQAAPPVQAVDVAAATLPGMDPGLAKTDPVFRAMGDELRRSTERLQMEKLGKPYFVSATVQDNYRLEIEGSFGAVKDPNAARSRTVRILLRVGDASFDNTNYVGKDYWQFGPFTEWSPFEDDYDALRTALWTAADGAYKHAVEKLSQKKAYKNAKNITEEIPDLSTETVRSSALRPQESPFDQAHWEELVRRLSSVFRKYPAVQSSSISLNFTQRAERYADSEGRKVLKPADDFEIIFSASAQASDGMGVSDRRRVIRQKLADLPPPEELEAEAVGLAEDVTALAAAPLAEPYIGPVLFEDQAAAEFFNQLFARNIATPRSLWIEEERVKEQFKSGDLADRLGLRVVSPLLDVFDDPSRESFNGVPLLGRYGVDDEGIPAQKVSLVEKGILKDLLMSRTPVKERRRSNGHGRGTLREFPTARIGSLVVRAEKTLPFHELRRELQRRALEFGQSYGLLIRRVAEEDDQEEGEILASPTLVYKIDVKTGKEELLRNAQFSGVTLRALRDVAAASDRNFVYNYYQLGPYKRSRGQTQASIICPSVLLTEMELKKTEKKPEKPPHLKHPYF